MLSVLNFVSTVPIFDVVVPGQTGSVFSLGPYSRLSEGFGEETDQSYRQPTTGSKTAIARFVVSAGTTAVRPLVFLGMRLPTGRS